MSTVGADFDRLTEPLRNTSRRFYIAVAVTALLSFATLVAYLSQLRFGMAITGLHGWGTQGGVPWGLYIGTFIWWIGIAHGGVAISAAVRLFDFQEYVPIARIAEVLTLIALPMAATNILLDLGRPDQMWVMITNWPSTVQTSPLTWDMTATFLYFMMAGTYLVITLRADLYECLQRGTLPSSLSPLYKLLLAGYSPSETEKTERMAWWMAVGILLLVPLMSGGVVPWLFATMGMHVGWFGAAQGPAMFAESMTSAIAAVVVTAAAFRWAYGWDDIIGDEIFKGLNKALIALVLVTLWFLIQDVVTGTYPAAPEDVSQLTASLLTGSMAVPFWLAVGGLGIPLAYLVAQALRPSLYSVAASAVAALLITSSILLKKIVFVVEGLLYPTREPLASMFPENSYWPTVPEFMMAFGTIAVAALVFLVATKVIPIVELGHASSTAGHAEADQEVSDQ